MGDTSLIKMIAGITSALTQAAHLTQSVLYGIDEYKDKVKWEYLQSPNVLTFMQTDSNTTCGWGGIGGQAFTNFWLIVVEFSDYGVAVVFHGRPAYICKMDDAYEDCIKSRSMPLWYSLGTRMHKLNILWKASK